MICAEMTLQVSGAIKETDPAELIQLTLVGLHGYVTLAVEPLQLSTYKKTVHEIPDRYVPPLAIERGCLIIRPVPPETGPGSPCLPVPAV